MSGADGLPVDGKRGSIFRKPVFSRLFYSSVFSYTGSAAGLIAVIWLVYTTTGSAVDVALAGIVEMVPMVAFGLFSGGLADRYSKTTLMVLGDLARAVMLFTLVASLELFSFNLLLVLLSAFVLGMGQSLFRISLNSFIPSTVDPDQLGTANGLLMSSQQLFSVIGSPMGGALIAVIGVPLTLLINGLTYLASSILVASAGIRAGSEGSVKGETEAEKTHILRDIADGFAYLKGEKGLLKLTLSSLVANFFTSLFFTFIVVYVSDVLLQGAFVFGVLTAASGAGFGAGAIISGRRRFEGKFGIWYTLGWGLAGLAILGVVFSPGYPTASLFMFAIGFGGGFGNTVFFTGVQKYVPGRMLARYLSIDEVGSLAASPAGQASGGVLIAGLGIPVVYIMASIGIAASIFVLLLFPDVRSLHAD